MKTSRKERLFAQALQADAFRNDLARDCSGCIMIRP